MTGARIRRHAHSTHRPGGSDPTFPGPWHRVGEAGEPDFINGFNMAPTAAIPNPSPLQFRLTTGAPNMVDGNGQILAYSEHQLEIEGDVDGVAPGDIVFVLPPAYRKDKDKPCHSHDKMNNYVGCRLLSSGEFIYGKP